MKYYNQKDYPKALEHLNSAASQGHPAAQYRLGFMHYMGEGLGEQSSTKAEHFYTLSANQGNPDAQLKLGEIYIGRVETYDKAHNYLSLCANQKIPDSAQYANYHLGIIYMNGYGVPADLQKAKYHFQTSVDQGNQLALLLKLFEIEAQ